MFILRSVPSKPFQVNLMYVSKARAYLSEAYSIRLQSGATTLSIMVYL